MYSSDVSEEEGEGQQKATAQAETAKHCLPSSEERCWQARAED